ncbi:MAG: hypothetical protein ACI9JN_002984, partial [Bacteroidia bacterium]
SMPPWHPAVHNGVKAISQMVLNFQFNYVDPLLDYDTEQYLYYEESEVSPTFIGGLDSIRTFVTSMFRDTFSLEFDSVVATIQFVVGVDSSVIDAEVLCNDNVIKDDYWIYAIRSLPNCIPGLIRRKPVNVQTSLSLSLYFDVESDN